MIGCLWNPALAKQKTHKRSIHGSLSRTKSSDYAVPVTITGTAQLASQLNTIINSNNTNGYVAVYVKSMNNGESLYMRNVYQPLMPASTMKVLTAEAALLYLGPDYRFTTQLLTDAKGVSNGVLQGNLYIVLSGDPTLTYQDLVQLMLTLQEKHIQSIAGNVYIDSTAYDQKFYGPGWENKDIKNYCFAAPISASIINHNCLPFQVKPTKGGRNAQVMTSSKYFYPMIRNSVITKSRRTRLCSVKLSSDPTNVISIDGCMSPGRYAWGMTYVVSDVPEYNRALFKSVLRGLDIRVYGSVTFGTAPTRLSLIDMHSSKPLNEMLKDMLKKSDNVIAGALFKKIGQLYTRQQGSWENGSVAVSQILSRKAGVNTSGMRILDGSGLSSSNLTTPAQLMQVLEFAYRHPTRDHFISALPVAGVDGTLKHRMGNIMRRVRAKTGTISGVVSLAGYASSPNEILAFVIMVNGPRGYAWRYRAMEDKIATALTRFRRV